MLAATQDLTSRFKDKFEDLKKMQQEIEHKYGTGLYKTMGTPLSVTNIGFSANNQFKFADKFKEYEQKWRDPFSSVLSKESESVEKSDNNSFFLESKRLSVF